MNWIEHVLHSMRSTDVIIITTLLDLLIWTEVRGSAPVFAWLLPAVLCEVCDTPRFLNNILKEFLAAEQTWAKLPKESALKVEDLQCFHSHHRINPALLPYSRQLSTLLIIRIQKRIIFFTVRHFC